MSIYFSMIFFTQYIEKILGRIAHNVPVVYDVPRAATRRRRVCALGWCCHSLFLLALPVPPTGGAPTIKWGVHQYAERGRGRFSARSVYNPVMCSKILYFVSRPHGRGRFLFPFFVLCFPYISPIIFYHIFLIFFSFHDFYIINPLIFCQPALIIIKYFHYIII